jgi:hypothetical protein
LAHWWVRLSVFFQMYFLYGRPTGKQEMIGTSGSIEGIKRDGDGAMIAELLALGQVIEETITGKD